MQKRICASVVVLLVGIAMVQNASAYETAITDTTDYTVLSAADGNGQSSIANGVHFGGSLSNTKDYLANNSSWDLRTPATTGANTTFGGRSLTLDGGARVILKGKSSKTTISDFRLYNSRLHHGEGSSALTIAGGMTICATNAANPALVHGAGGRSLTLESSISGASGTWIKVESSGDAHTGSNPFFLNLTGNNSGYAGSFEVVGERFALVGYNGNALGSSPNIKLTDGGRLFSGGESTVALPSAAITLNNGGVFGVYTKTGSNVGLQISSGTISGTGTLTIDNTGTEGAHDRRVALGNVSITGIDGIVANNTLQLVSGYDNASVPITVAQPRMLRLTSGVKAGPVTLQAGANVESSDENVSLASLTLETTAAGTPFIRKYLHKGLVTISGNITNNLSANEKIRIDFTVTAITQLANAQSFRVLSAANLGDTGVTAADFVATYENGNIVEELRPYILDGTFSIETVGDVKYLVYTLASKAVYSTETDTYNDHSLDSAGHWNSGKAPEEGFAYFAVNGHQVRSLRNGTTDFKGDSLTILSGGKLAVQGGGSGLKTTIADLRLCGGGILTTTTDWGNNLHGAVVVYGSSSNPVIFETEVTSGDSRALTIAAPISGSGSMLCRYQNVSFGVATYATLNLRGDNAGFTGEWQVMHPAAKATFSSAANFGSASALVFNSNGVFRAQEGSFAISAPVVVKNVGSVSGNEDLTNGGTIEVDEGQTLTVNGVVSGAGILRKTGAGALRLMAENTISGNVVVKQGYVGGAGKVTSVELADGAGLDVSMTQEAPFEIGSLTVDGNVVLNIRDAANVSRDKIAVAKVGALTGTLDEARATVDGKRRGIYLLSVEDGVLYATRQGLVLSIR